MFVINTAKIFSNGNFTKKKIRLPLPVDLFKQIIGKMLILMPQNQTRSWNNKWLKHIGFISVKVGKNNQK